MKKDIGAQLKDLSAKANNLMKITQEQEAFAKRKQDCFMEMLTIIEELSTANEMGSQDIEGFAMDAKELLTKYKDDLGKETKE